MKRTAWMFVYLAILVISSPNALANTKTFDDLATGEYGQSLLYGDIAVKAIPTAHLMITDFTSDGFGKAHSLPNKLSVRGGEPLTTEQTSMLIDFANPVEGVNFWLTGTFHDTTVTAYNNFGTSIESFTQTYPTSGSTAPDGRPWDFYYDDQLRFIELSSSGISQLFIQPSAHDGFSIDDLSYTVTPEPVSAALFLLGGGTLLLRKRRFKHNRP